MFDAIPSGLKCLFKGTVNNDNVSLRSDIAIKGVPITDKRWNNYFIRTLLIEYNPISSKIFWHSKIEYIDWKYAWLLPKKYCITNKVREVHFKILHLVYPTKTLFLGVVLMWMIGVASVEQRRRMQATFNCIYSQMFWIDLEGLLCKYLGMNVYFF